MVHTHTAHRSLSHLAAARLLAAAAAAAAALDADVRQAGPLGALGVLPVFVFGFVVVIIYIFGRVLSCVIHGLAYLSCSMDTNINKSVLYD